MKEAVEGKGHSGRAATSPMPGTVTKVFRKAGDKLKKGDSIVAMEAMKMELVIKAEADCVVAKIHVAEGDFVEASKIMV